MAREPNLTGYLLENDGDPKTGTIYFLRQLHSTLTDNIDSRKKIAHNQGLLLEEMINLNLNEIFSEGSVKGNRGVLNDGKSLFLKDYVDFQTGEHIPKETPIKEIRKHFNNFLNKNSLSESQMSDLYSFGATLIYPLIKQGCTRHLTVTEEQDKFMWQMLDNVLNQGINPSSVIEELRENYALGAIKEFWESGGNREVILVYGAAHNFADNLNNLFNPRLYSKNLSGYDLVKSEKGYGIPQAYNKEDIELIRKERELAKKHGYD